MGRIRANNTRSDEPIDNALLHNFFKQPQEHPVEQRLTTPKPQDRAMIRHTFKEVKSEIPAQGVISFNPMLNLPL